MANFIGYFREITTLITVCLQVVGSRVGRIDLTYGAAWLFRAANSSGIAMAGKGSCNLRPWARNLERSYTAVGSARPR